MHLFSAITISLAASLTAAAAIDTAAAAAATPSKCPDFLAKTKECCPQPHSFTTTSYANCGSCVAPKTAELNCDIVCHPSFLSSSLPQPTYQAKLTIPQVRCAHATTLPGTTTLTACATATPASAAPCTSTITSTSPFGCTITVPASTMTSSVDCKGCVLETVTVANSRLGMGPVCVDGRKTVTASLAKDVQTGTGASGVAVATETACFTSGGL